MCARARVTFDIRDEDEKRTGRRNVIWLCWYFDHRNSFNIYFCRVFKFFISLEIRVSPIMCRCLAFFFVQWSFQKWTVNNNNGKITFASVHVLRAVKHISFQEKKTIILFHFVYYFHLRKSAFKWCAQQHYSVQVHFSHFTKIELTKIKWRTSSVTARPTTTTMKSLWRRTCFSEIVRAQL